MNKTGVAALALLGLVAMPMTTHAAGARDEVVAAYAAWDAAFNTGDEMKVCALYTDDSVLLPPSHDVLQGPAGVEKFFAGLFAAGVTGHKLELIEVMGDDAGKDVVAAAKWSAKAKDGSAVGGIATHVFEKQPDGSLKLKLHTFN